MSCISSNFSSFFLNSLNDSSEFAKYLSNGELRFSSFEDFQVFGTDATGAGTPPPPTQSQQQPPTQQAASQQQQLQQQQQYYNGVGNGSANVNAGVNAAPLHGVGLGAATNGGDVYNGVVGQTQNLAETAGNAVTAPANATQPGGVPLPHGTHMHPTHVAHTHPHPHHAPPPHHPYAPPNPATGPHATNAFHHPHHHNHHATTHLAQGLPTSAAAAPNYPTTPQRWPTSSTAASGNPMVTATPGTPHTLSQLQNSSNNQPGTPIAGAAAAHTNPSGAQHFDGSFEFLKYLRHSNDYTAEGQAADASGAGGRATPQAGQTQSSTSSSSLIDLDSSTAHKSRSSRKAAALLSSVSRASNSLDANTLDVFDHDSKHTIFDMQHVNATSGSNSNESSLEVSNLAFPSSHLNASNSNTSSEGAATGSSDFTMLQTGAAPSAPKPLATFTIKENFEAHPSHKVEEGIFQHMNKLPAKKKETLKQLGVRFTGQMTLSDKSVVVENFVKFCQEYDVQDHRPFLSLNQSGLNKADQIKFARYLGQGLPTFTLFCIYSNFKNLFCTKRTEIYTKDGYNLPYILDKTKRFLSSTTAGNTPNKNNSNASLSQSLPAPKTQPPPQPQTPLQSQPPPPQPPQSQTQPIQHPLPPQVQSPRPLTPHSLPPHAVQSQPLQPQPPTTPQTQPLPHQMMQTPPPPPTHIRQLQQQQPQHPVHIPMPNSMDLKNMVHQQSNDGMDFGSLDSSGTGSRVSNSFDSQPARPVPKILENLMIYENFDVHETHRVEDGVCTHITRLPPKKQEMFKQFGIQSNQIVTFYEKYILIENFSKFCNEYKISDHRPFLDFHDSGLPKCEQVKFVRYLGQGLPNLTLNKIYLSFKEILGMSRMEKLSNNDFSGANCRKSSIIITTCSIKKDIELIGQLIADSTERSIGSFMIQILTRANAEAYNMETILKKKKKIFYNRMQAAVQRESSEPMQTSAPAPAVAEQQTSVKPTPQQPDGFKT